MSQGPSRNEDLTLASFLAESAHYRLGHLPTETPHPATLRLSDWAQHDIASALAALVQVDAGALLALRACDHDVAALTKDIHATLAAGGRIFLCGCGATGRLALSLEMLWLRGGGSPGAVIGFMAGGDVALIRSVEGFEDHPEYAHRQLGDLGFSKGDRLLAITEGGETPFVIGAAEYAAAHSAVAPWFLYCNPDSALASIERSRRVLEHPFIRKLCIDTGPMALAGSTRMQASTVLMAAAGCALFRMPAAELANELSRALAAVSTHELEQLILAESSIYTRGGYVLYRPGDFALTVLTDTTERAPTFSLTPFENSLEPGDTAALCNIELDAASSEEAWTALLGRPPRPLDWHEPRVGRERLLGFDFSRGALARRRTRTGCQDHSIFDLRSHGSDILLRLSDANLRLQPAVTSELAKQLHLKMILNMHSTLVMGRLSRFESNVMTWVRPANRKLIDRAIRYIDRIVQHRGGPALAYEVIAQELFTQLPGLQHNQSIVLQVANVLQPQSA